MKQPLKATAAVIGVIATVVIFNYFIRAVGCLMIHIPKTCNVSL